MTEPRRPQANAARSYFDMMGVTSRPRPRRRGGIEIDDVEIGAARVEPDVEIGEAQMLPDDDDIEIGGPRTDVAPAREMTVPEIEVIGDARPSFVDSLHSQDPMAIAGRTIAQLEAQQPVTQARQATHRAELERNVDRDRRRDAAYDRSLIDGLVMDSDNLEALRAGTVQGVTLGFGDELAGASVHPWDRQAQPRGFAEAPRATYESERDRVRTENETARTAAPRSYMGGEILGSALPALAMPGANARSVAGRVGQSTLMGGAFGGAQGLGHAQGTAREQATDTLAGAGYGAAGGAAGQLVGEGAAGAARWLRGAPEGTPVPGGDFTPEQQARIDADPELADMGLQRDQHEFRAAVRRVQTAHPNATPADLERIESTYEGGVRGLARDLDASGMSPRRSVPSTPEVQRRATLAQRQAPAPMVEDEVVLGMPEGAQAGRFNDDVTLHPAPDPNYVPSARRWTDDIAPDPHDVHPANPNAIPFDPNDTLEMQMRREFEREGRSTGASTQAGTNPNVRAGARARGRVPEEISTDAFQAVTNPPVSARPTTTDVADDAFDLFPVSPQTRATIERGQLADSATSSASRAPGSERSYQAQQSFERQYGTPQVAPARGSTVAPGELDARGVRRAQSNVVAAEQRAERGALSHATQEDRPWPVSMDEVEDITLGEVPQPIPERAPVAPPPLPRRPAPAPDLGRWDAPNVEPAPAPAPRTPGQRAAPVVEELGRRAEMERLTRGGVTDQRGFTRRIVEDHIADNFLRGRSAGASATANEARADMLARDIVRRLNDNPATRTYAEQLLQAHQSSGPRGFGVALQQLARTQPDVADELENVPWDNRDYEPLHMRQSAPAQARVVEPSTEAPTSEWDTPYTPRSRRQ